MHAYAHLGQVTLRSPFLLRTQLVTTTTTVRPVALRRPPLRRSRFCPSEVSYHVDHAHRLLIPREALSFGQVVYRTSVDNDHSHSVELTEQDVLALGYGATLRKVTSRDARRGGSPHVHYVRVSCVQALSYGAPYAYAALVPASVTIY